MSSNFIEALGGAKVYPITDRHLSAQSHADQVLQLAAGGATLVQLRDKTSSPLDFYLEAEVAVRAARQRGIKIVINDRVDIAKALHADGVHLGQDDLPPAAAREILGTNAIIGFSTHNPAQAKIATSYPVDYIAIGPVFPTATKGASDPTVGLETVALLREVLGSMPLVAIGGITLENSNSVLDAGADALAVIGDIWHSSRSPTAQVKLFLELR